MAADMEGWRGNFGNEIIKQWIVHERDIFLGNSGHFLGYGKLGYQKAIRPKWADQNTVFPIYFLIFHIRPPGRTNPKFWASDCIFGLKRE